MLSGFFVNHVQMREQKSGIHRGRLGEFRAKAGEISANHRLAQIACSLGKAYELYES